MKQVKLIFKKGGTCKILAHDTYGAGTMEFTLELAEALGTIKERHAGRWHSHTGIDLSSDQNEKPVNVEQKVTN